MPPRSGGNLTWVWRLSLLTDPILPHDSEPDPSSIPPDDIDELLRDWTPTGPVTDAPGPDDPRDAPLNEPVPPADREGTEPADTDPDTALLFEAVTRRALPAPELTDAEARHQMDRRDAWHNAPPRERLVLVNHLTSKFYERCFTTDAWARSYVSDRFGHDLAGSPFRPGYAPDSWTALVNHLRRHGVADSEMTAAGVALTASTGRLIDRFRDRVVFPITDPDGAVLGFIGRRNPARTDTDNRGPKYLNTAETVLFRKGDQLFIGGHLDPATTPVISEGPFDAIAITLASDGSHVGVAPLGTSLTTAQVAQLREHPIAPVVATDPDLAGRIAAERDYWLLAAAGLSPGYADLPAGLDPADMLTGGRADQLTAAIAAATPLGYTLIDERLTNLPREGAALDAMWVLAAQPPEHWISGAEHIAERLDLPSSLIRAGLLGMVRAWNTDPRRAANQALSQLNQVKQRLANAATLAAAEADPEHARPNTTAAAPPLTPLGGHPRRHGVDR